MTTLSKISKKHTRRLKPNKIDRELSNLCAQAKDGETRNYREIADACGCSQSAIQQIAANALKKLARNSLMQQHHADSL